VSAAGTRPVPPAQFVPPLKVQADARPVSRPAMAEVIADVLAGRRRPDDPSLRAAVSPPPGP
jgi:hypothetical protein